LRFLGKNRQLQKSKYYMFQQGRTNDDWAISGAKISTCRPASLLIHFIDHEVTRKSPNLKQRSAHPKGHVSGTKRSVSET